MPSAEVERRSSMPLMVLTASSMRLETCVSTSSGAAPRSVVVTVTIGRSIFGKRSTPSFAIRIDAEHHQRHDQHGGEHRPPDTDFCEFLHESVSFGFASTLLLGSRCNRRAATTHRCACDELVQRAGGDTVSRVHERRAGTSIQPSHSCPGLILCSTARPSRITNSLVRPATV